MKGDNKMKNKKLILVSVLLLLALALSACGSKPAGIEGTWKPEGEQTFTDFLSNSGVDTNAMTMEFTKEGKLVPLVDGKPMVEALKTSMIASGLVTEESFAELNIQEPEMNYKTDGDTLTLSVKAGENATQHAGTYKVEGDKLTMTVDGETYTFTRVK